MSKRFALIVTAIFLTLPLLSQDKVKWYTIEEAEKLMGQAPRPLFIDTYTDWCGWCKKMDKETFTDPVIAEILNTSYYPVKFDAESKDSVTFLGQTFINDGKSGAAHQLAVVLLQGQLSYPTTVVLSPVDGKIYVNPIVGFREAKEMELLLSYLGDNKNMETDFEQYKSSFKGKIK